MRNDFDLDGGVLLSVPSRRQRKVEREEAPKTPHVLVIADEPPLPAVSPPPHDPAGLLTMKLRLYSRPPRCLGELR